jgi:NhaP-type Na+/H+ or K+/H+ antiporter
VDEGKLVLVVGVLLAAGLVASLAAGRLRVPGLVMVLALGMAIGSDGLGWIHFGEDRAADFELARQASVDPGPFAELREVDLLLGLREPGRSLAAALLRRGRRQLLADHA